MAARLGDRHGFETPGRREEAHPSAWRDPATNGRARTSILSGWVLSGWVTSCGSDADDGTPSDRLARKAHVRAVGPAVVLIATTGGGTGSPSAARRRRATPSMPGRLVLMGSGHDSPIGQHPVALEGLVPGETVARVPGRGGTLRSANMPAPARVAPSSARPTPWTDMEPTGPDVSPVACGVSQGRPATRSGQDPHAGSLRWPEKAVKETFRIHAPRSLRCTCRAGRHGSCQKRDCPRHTTHLLL